MNIGERQVAPFISAIAPDHTARYKLAAALLGDDITEIVDLGCGVGYGANILAQCGFFVTAIDRDHEAIEYAKQHFDHPKIDFICGDIRDMKKALADSTDAVIAFEIIEHLEEASTLIGKISKRTKRLIFSVPNEEVTPFSKERFPFHVRHYKPEELAALAFPFSIEAVYSQPDKWSEIIHENADGKNLIVDCEF